MTAKSSLFLAFLFALLLTLGCSGKTAGVAPSNGSSATGVSGNWWVTAPNGTSTCCGLALDQSGASVTGLASPAICGLTTLQGTLGANNNLTLTAGNGALAIDAAASVSASAGTLSGTETCGVTTSPFNATRIGNLTGQWVGIFTAVTLNNGFRTNVTISLTEGTASAGTFPSLTGLATFTPSPGSQSSCLAAATGGTITSGSLVGNLATLQILTTTGKLILTISGAANAPGNQMSPVSYSLLCGTGSFDGQMETGTGTLSD